MIFTKIEIDNFYGFKNAILDLTIKREVKNSTVAHEFLEGREKFRFKRICILTGPNASGKTSLGRLMCNFQNFVRYFDGGALEEIINSIRDKSERAFLRFDFVSPKTFKAKRIYITIFPKKETDRSDERKFEITYLETKIGKNDSTCKIQKKLDKFFRAKKAPKGSLYIKSMLNFPQGRLFTPLSIFLKIHKAIRNDSYGWYYCCSGNMGETTTLELKSLDADILYKVLASFDPSIIRVEELFKEKELRAFSIKFSNGENLIMEPGGEIAKEKIDRLSKGTYEAIHVADLLCYLKQTGELIQQKGSFTYFFDEKLPFSHSELEKAVLNIVIDKLPVNAQFFYTTHNLDILEMTLPIHSFVFLKKEGEFSTFINPEKTFKKNDRSLVNYVKNNVFSTLPDITTLENMLWEE